MSIANLLVQNPLSIYAEREIVDLGSVSAPSYTFVNDTNTGIYSPTANQLGFTCDSTEVINMSSSAISFLVPLSLTNILVDDGTVSAPSYSFTNSTSTGIYSSALNTLNLSANGTNIFQGTSTLITSNVALTIASGNLSLTTGQILSNNGLVSAPSYSFTNSTSTGIYSSGANVLDFAVNGANSISLSSSISTFEIFSSFDGGIRNGTNTLPIIDTLLITDINTAGGATYTTSQVLGGLIRRDANGANRVDALPTAVDLVAAIPNVAVGNSFVFTVWNDSAFTVQVNAGAGGSNNMSTAQYIIQANASATFRVVITNITGSSEAYELYLN